VLHPRDAESLAQYERIYIDYVKLFGAELW